MYDIVMNVFSKGILKPMEYFVHPGADYRLLVHQNF